MAWTTSKPTMLTVATGTHCTMIRGGAMVLAEGELELLREIIRDTHASWGISRKDGQAHGRRIQFMAVNLWDQRTVQQIPVAAYHHSRTRADHTAPLSLSQHKIHPSPPPLCIPPASPRRFPMPTPTPTTPTLLQQETLFFPFFLNLGFLGQASSGQPWRRWP